MSRRVRDGIDSKNYARSALHAIDRLGLLVRGDVGYIEIHIDDVVIIERIDAPDKQHAAV